MMVMKKANSAENLSAENLDEIKEECIISIANTDKVSAANNLLARTFNIDSSYYVTGIKDSGNTMTISVANKSFEVTVKIKDTEILNVGEEE